MTVATSVVLIKMIMKLGAILLSVIFICNMIAASRKA